MHRYKTDPPALVHPNILVGAGEMLTPQFVKKHEITHVINCTEDTVSPSWFRNEYPTRYHSLNAIDDLSVNILSWYPEFKAIMKSYLQHPESKIIFVHCQCGINRSAFLTLMYVCDVFKFKHADTKLSILNQRPCALTNVSFQKQVLEAISKDGKY